MLLRRGRHPAQLLSQRIFSLRDTLPEVGALPEFHLNLLDQYDALGASPDFHLELWLEPGGMQFIQLFRPRNCSK
jgi:hypothetical protein